jgi:hypothetical protein
VRRVSPACTAPVANILERKHSLTGHEGDGAIAGQQSIEEILRQLANGTVEEFDRVMAGVKPTQRLIRQHHPITQPILARKE